VSCTYKKVASLKFLSLVLLVAFTHPVIGENATERSFPQSKLAVEKKLKELQSATAGRLPLLDGFVVPGNRPLDRFQRAYYQCTVAVSPTSSGGSLVRVNAKITAWYADPSGSKSGYQLLPSNGRLENDLLDQLTELLGVNAPTSPGTPEGSPRTRSSSSDTSGSLISAPMPRIPAATLGAAAVSPGKMDQNQPASLRTQTEAAEKHERELAAQARNLEEILNNQAHPNNLAAVKKTGTPVVANPAADGKVLFAATLGDEFEILDETPQWVHVRISGISRGWIKRSSVEMPGDEAAKAKASGTSGESDGTAFHVGSQQFGAFPGDWAPLRGKTVEIISVQKSSENAPNAGAHERMEFAKAFFTNEYDKVTSTAEGIVLIFDSDDGGMVAATLPSLQQWKAGTLSDEAFWRQCFFDPPEILSAVPTTTK
jgi:hypothetical protein